LRHIKYLLPILLLTAAMFIVPVIALADDPGDPGPDPVPFDGGATALVVTGVAYGIKKIKESRKKNNRVKEVTIK
jgi:hypothetical protein